MKKQLIQMTREELGAMFDVNGKDTVLDWIMARIVDLRFDIGTVRVMVDGMSNQLVVKDKLLNYIDEYML